MGVVVREKETFKNSFFGSCRKVGKVCSSTTRRGVPLCLDERVGREKKSIYEKKFRICRIWYGEWIEKEEGGERKGEGLSSAFFPYPPKNQND